MLRMDEFNKIRKEFHVRGKSIYQIAREYNRSWQTIKSIVHMPEHKIESRGKRPGRNPIVITPEVEKQILQYLDFEEVHRVPRKQRFTAACIFKKLTSDGVYQGSAKRLRTIVSVLRKERKQIKKNVFLDLDFEFGKYLQVDHGPAEIAIKDKRISGYLFVASVPGTSLRYCQFYLTKACEAWGHFHELIFNFFGGTFPYIIYDNDTVLKVGKTNEPTQFCVELQIHYKFEAIFCNKAAGWEKGSVENAVGFCRRNFLAGVPQFNSISDLNNYLEEECLNHIINEKHYVSKRPLHELYDELKDKLSPFTKGKPWGRWEDLKVDSFQQIHYQNYGYSVPERFVGFKVKVFITASSINIYDGNDLICSHNRLFYEEGDSLVLDHYLEQLYKKPRAILHAKVFKEHKFETHILELKRRLYNKFKEKEAGLNLIQILLLKRKSSHCDFNTAIQLALSYGAITFDAIKSILYQLQTQQLRSIDELQYPTIDHHFSLNKYEQLERQEIQYD